MAKKTKISDSVAFLVEVVDTKKLNEIIKTQKNYLADLYQHAIQIDRNKLLTFVEKIAALSKLEKTLVAHLELGKKLIALNRELVIKSQLMMPKKIKNDLNKFSAEYKAIIKFIKARKARYTRAV